MAKSRGIGKGKGNTGKSHYAGRTKNGGRNQAKLNTWEKNDTATKVIEWVLEGHSKYTIRDMILQRFPEVLNADDATKLIRFSLARLEEISKQDAQTVVNVHLELYEKIYAYFEEIEHTQGMNKVMKAKEKLLGLLKDKNKLVINQKKTTVIHREVNYNTSKLNEEQRERLDYLINKAK